MSKQELPLTQEQIAEFHDRVLKWTVAHTRLWTGYGTIAQLNEPGVPEETLDKIFDSEDI